MKAYIIYIATLLAALALPASAQHNNTETKAAPEKPAMPYRLSTLLTGNAHGTVTVEDNMADGNGIVFAGNDTLVYGASGNNATTVKLTVTPDNGYAIRKGYPKAYKTGVTGTKVTITGDNSPYTFKMPAYPVTLEIAYAHLLTGFRSITLKEEISTAEAVIVALPKNIDALFANGSETLTVGSFSYDATDNNGNDSGYNNGGTDGTFNAAPGAVNVFRFTLASALPDSIADAKTPLLTGLTGKVKVANMAQPLVPTEENKDKGIVISGATGDNLSSNTDGAGEQLFNGTIGSDDQATEVKALEVNESVKEATLILKNVNVSGGDTPEEAKTEVKSGADLTLKVEGSSSLGTLVVNNGASVVFDIAEGAKLESTTVSNSGIFRDSTATLTKVDGTGKLDIKGDLTGGGKVTTNTKVTLTASTNDIGGITTFIWQKQNADGSFTEVARQAYDESGNKTSSGQTKAGTTGISDRFEPDTKTVGTIRYHCLIERTVTSGSTGSPATVTLLSTQPAKVEVKSGGSPVIPATYYTITLPALEGFSSSPAPGQYSVEEGYSFSFSLTPAEGNTSFVPVVTTSRGETITPRESDGKYVIKRIYEDITVSLASLPTSIEALGTEGIRIAATSGQLHIHAPQPVLVTVYTLSGHSIRKLDIPAGDSMIKLPAGFYIVTAGHQKQKVIIR